MNPVTEKWMTIRRQLHAQPETAFEEEKTAKKISDLLAKMPGLNVLTGLGGTGVLATLDTGVKGPSILLRAELDALPLNEDNDIPYRSVENGKAHLCGHDGHATMLLWAAEKLAISPPERGKVFFLFQPAEETGEGALAVLNDPNFSMAQPLDRVFALHNLPGFPLGQVVLRKGQFNAGVCSMIVQLQGKTAHAAEPDKGNNPAGVMARILDYASSKNQPDKEKSDFALVVPIYARLGQKAYGTSAGDGEVHFTLRTWDRELLNALSTSLSNEISGMASEVGLTCRISWTESFYPIINNDRPVDEVAMAAQQLNVPIKWIDHPFAWGEDFGYFTTKFEGAFFGLGAGEQVSSLHHPHYDFPDNLLEIGALLLAKLVRNTQ